MPLPRSRTAASRAVPRFMPVNGNVADESLGVVAPVVGVVAVGEPELGAEVELGVVGVDVVPLAGVDGVPEAASTTIVPFMNGCTMQ